MKKLLSLAIYLSRALENIFQFIAVVALLYLLLYTTYMMFSLANSNIFNFFEPVANVINSIASLIWRKGNDGAMQIGGFITGLLLIISVFLFSQFIKQRCNNLAKFFNDLKFDYLKSEERRINKELHNNIQRMNNKISYSFMYVELREKENASEKVDLDEQYKILNQFLYSKTLVLPERSGEGYVYKFTTKIDHIDADLKYFFRALHSQAPVDYMFIFQVIETTFDNALFDVSKLKKAGIYNKIIMTPTTNLRYESNIKKDYNTGVVGNYVFAGESHSIYELKEKFF